MNTNSKKNNGFRHKEIEEDGFCYYILYFLFFDREFEYLSYNYFKCYKLLKKNNRLIESNKPDLKLSKNKS